MSPGPGDSGDIDKIDRPDSITQDDGQLGYPGLARDRDPIKPEDDGH